MKSSRTRWRIVDKTVIELDDQQIKCHVNQQWGGRCQEANVTLSYINGGRAQKRGSDDVFPCAWQWPDHIWCIAFHSGS
jgi:hypothetical protein